jgi:hypothetical protein
LDEDIDAPSIAVDVSSSSTSFAPSPLTLAKIVGSYKISQVTFFEIQVKNERGEKWTILRRYTWFKLIYDMLIARGLTLVETSQFAATSIIASWFTLSQEDDQPAETRREGLNRFLAEIISKKVYEVPLFSRQNFSSPLISL